MIWVVCDIPLAADPSGNEGQSRQLVLQLRSGAGSFEGQAVCCPSPVSSDLVQCLRGSEEEFHHLTTQIINNYACSQLQAYRMVLSQHCLSFCGRTSGSIAGYHPFRSLLVVVDC